MHGLVSWVVLERSATFPHWDDLVRVFDVTVEIEDNGEANAVALGIVPSATLAVPTGLVEKLRRHFKVTLLGESQ